MTDPTNNNPPATSDCDAEKAATIVHELANQLGFAMAGIAPAQASDNEQALQDWLDEKKYGEMAYLANYTPQRLDPAVILPGAQSVICLADVYTGSDTDTADSNSPAQGRIARYAWGGDYHKIIKRRLFALADALKESWPDAEFKCCVDTAPVLEREHAMRAGLGWVGKHTLVIHPQLGSWFLLGEIITTLKIQTSEQANWPGTTVPPTDHCGTCTRCIDACPTDCITPYSLDATRCISYLTIEHRSEIDLDLQKQMSDWVAGCDVCQQVCPHNREDRNHSAASPSAPITILDQYKTRPPGPRISLLEILNWSPEDRQRVLTGSALKRIKLDMWKRNAIIAAGNALAKHDQPELSKRIQQISRDANESQLVQNTAAQVISRLA